MKIQRIAVLAAALLALVCLLPFRLVPAGPLTAAADTLRGKKSIEDRLEQFGPIVRSRLSADFTRINVTYPPGKVTLVGIKQDNLLEVWVGDPPKLLKTYPILGASGVLGPKQREGDLQVPEGIYQIESLNPNSLYHLSLRLNYPNQSDRKQGELDGRHDLGSDIMIHGNTCSIGCLAMGDQAAEDLFILAAETGVRNIKVILTPVDFRKNKLPESMPELPQWTSKLYQSISAELEKLHPPQPADPGHSETPQ